MADMFKIYTGDYSKEGYDGGIDDAKKAKTKNKFKFFKAVNPINYVWNFNNAFDSFMQNYDKGYLDGQRVVNEVYTNSTQGEKMSSNQNYEYHLQLLDELQRNLNNLKPKVDELREKYNNQLNTMHSAGFLDDYINPLKERYMVFKSKIEELQNLIDEHKRKISILEEATRDSQARARR